mmetsp:Transcript_25798/g.53886  ORF Transcript_25798/g.53886 Transcript_25798/m.53886 type:complete len:400 (+) Transcript_25798:287-1486(+)
MAYAAPLSERIRIQVEIFCENLADCVSSLSHNYKRPLLIVSGIAVLLTVRASRRGIKTAKMGGYGGYGGGAYGSYGAPKKKGLLSKVFGKKGAAATTTGYGATGSTSMYGGAGSTYGTVAGGMSSGYGTGAAGGGSAYSPGLRGTASAMGGTTGYGTTSTLGGGATSTYGSSLGGASSMNTMSRPGTTLGGGGGVAGGLGGAATAGGKSTANLADAQPQAVVALDASVHFYDYGGASGFSGQIETVQAFDAPNFVSQVLNQPGQNKVLVIDAGGLRSGMGAVFDGDMANAAVRNGWKGVIVNGAIRNAAQLSRMTTFGVKALGTSPKKGNAAMGQKGVAVTIGNSQLQPGWWVYADGDGVVMSQTDVSGGSFGSVGGGTSMMSSGGYGGGTAGSPLGGG